MHMEKKSHLEENYPEHAEFLKWHDKQMEKYNGAPVVAELMHKAREWVTKDIRLYTTKSNRIDQPPGESSG